MHEAVTDEKTRDNLFRHEMWLRDREAEIYFAAEKGREEGETIGETRGETRGRKEERKLINKLYDFIKANPGKSASEISSTLGCSTEDAEWGKRLFE